LNISEEFNVIVVTFSFKEATASRNSFSSMAPSSSSASLSSSSGVFSYMSYKDHVSSFLFAAGIISSSSPTSSFVFIGFNCGPSGIVTFSSGIMMFFFHQIFEFLSL